jgi:hypothetical protein
VILAVIVGGGILVYLRYFEKEIISLTKFSEIKKPEKPKIEEEIANWKTYRNEEYGFEIKYPKDWRVKARPPFFTFTPQLLDDKQFEITVLEEKIYQSLDEFLSENLKEPSAPICLAGNCVYPSFSKATKVELDNFVGIQYQIVYSGLGGLVEIATHIYKNGILFILEFRHWEIAEIKSEDLDFYNQMLSTFRFLE